MKKIFPVNSKQQITKTIFMKQIITILLTACCLSACKKEQKLLPVPVSDLGHVDLILDSTAFHAILQDSFLTNEFAVLSQDTTMYSKPSYDIYLTGREAFLHISLAKEYWADKAGSGVMIFQTRRPGKADSLLLGWKKFYRDSLIKHTFEGGDFSLGEIMPYRKKDSTRPVQPNFTPLLTSYSAQAYKNWGFNDSLINNGLPMQEFMNSWDTATQSKLFKKLKSLHVQLTEQEFTEMESALQTMGYEKQANGFTHAFNPSVYYTITEKNEVPKYTRIEIELAGAAAERTIHLGTAYTIKVKDSVMVIEQFKKDLEN
ncbi:hypothetical protein SAMN03097699_2308 [Flavobacteriaceae bacterium MAR_2010_188]|nr:hypothetical protein SAMN03097699_2308 [Flavobacteriaceae bacterium MAR_2010_188]